MEEMEKETELQWVKHGSSASASASILGKDVVVFGSGSFLTFVEASRADKKEVVYQANSEVKGDGVVCFCTHKTLPCFAFAEMSRNPRILVVSYPTFEVIKSFESVTDTNYLALRFSEMEYLVALSGVTDYRIVIWNWRTSEKLYIQETGLEHPSQILRISPTSPIQILQTTSADRQLIFWDMNICYKKTLLHKTTSFLPDTCELPCAFAYGADGDLYVTDTCAALYSINPETLICTLQIPGKEDKQTPFFPCVTWFKGGVVFPVFGEVNFWRRKSPEGWTKIWSVPCKTLFRSLVSSSVKDLLAGVNIMNEVVLMKGEHQVESVIAKSFGSDFEFLCLVNPVGDYLVTFGNEGKTFTVWNKTNGAKVSQLGWTKEKIKALQSNPRWPYLVAATEGGKIHVINVYDVNHVMELDNAYLTANSLDAVRFPGQGTHFCVANMDVGEFFLLKLPSKLEVLGHVRTDLKIVDFAVIEKNAGDIVLLVVPMSQFCCRSGQSILVYAFNDKLKTFDFVKDVAVPSLVTSFMPSSPSYGELYCIPHRSRRLCKITVQNGKMIGDFVSGHQMKCLSVRCGDAFVLTFSIDGLVIIKMADTMECLTIIQSHHRLSRGVRAVIVDPYMQYVVTLGENGSLVCMMVRKSDNLEKRTENESLMLDPAYKQILQNPVLSEKAKAKAFEKLLQHDREQAMEAMMIGELSLKKNKKIWLELREQEKINMEEQEYKKEKQSIQEELSGIRKKVKQLLDENFSNVPERQLPIQAFDLDKASRRKKLEDGKMEREKEKQLQLASTKTLNKITELIKKICWDSVAVKGRELHAILTPVVVQSYALMPDSADAKMTWLPERMRISQFFRKGDFFEPWVPRTNSSLELHINNKFQVSSLDVTQTIKTKYEEEQPEDEKTKGDSETARHSFVWTGTSSHHFIDVDPNHSSQLELTSFFQSHQEIRFIEVDIKKLMLWFNKKFSETFDQKEREMAVVYERNNKFRHIISELRFFNFSPNICSTQIFDPKWAPEENPETIMRVEDSEITVPMYISGSRMELLKKKEMEEEKLRQQLLADDFRERALMFMMDGVLEKLWEDEIKKDVPKPKCMVEKEPENWNEEDLRAIRAYEESVKALANERERYRKILEAEWSKTVAMVKDSVSKFDDKVMKLHLLKLRVESAIGQEILKGLRIRQRCFQRMQMDRKEEAIKASLARNEKKIESMTSELAKLVEMLGECRNCYEALLNKDRNLDKNFKKEFPEYSPIVCEQLYKISKKRPKLLQKPTMCSTVLNDMGKIALSGSKPEYMPTECIQYLKDIDALDAHSNAPAAVSQQSWELTCKLRRMKIDCELKIRACTMEVADAEATVTTWQKALKAAKDHHVQLQNDLQAVRAEKLNSSLNYQIQLVLKKGLVEIPLTGHVSDFEECVLVTKDILNRVNQSIHKMGQQKIKAMKKAANFRKGIIYKEWEHKKLRMEIEDLRSQLETVEKLQVLKELQAILVARARGFSDEKGFLYLENEIAGVKDKYEKAQNEIYSQMSDLDAKMDKIKTQNEKLDEKIAEMNVEMNEMNLGRDTDFDQKHQEENMKRMKKIRERGRLVRTIQDQHKQILVLQTELELLRLKTYPAIKYRIP